MFLKKVFPVLLFLVFSLGIATVCFGGDYALAVALNWGLSLPLGGRCVYEADSGASFQGDGFRYHVLEYASGTDDLRDQLWLLLLPGARQRLYIVESFL